jgi:hypothetical protein
MTFKNWFTQKDDVALGAQIKAATSIRMSKEEREDVRSSLHTYMRMRPVRNRVTRRAHSWTSFAFHPVPIVALSLLVVMSGTAGAAELALPGDLLYSIKVNVNEEVRAALATTPQAKASVAITRAETRIKEIEALEERGTIDEETRDDIEERLDTQIRVAEEKALEVEDENGSRATREQRLVAVLRAHETMLASEHVAVGGSLVPDVSFEEMVAADTSEQATTTLEVAATSALDAEVTNMQVDTAIPPPPPALVETKKAAEVEQPKQVEKKVAPGFSEKSIKRQQKAAEQRIDALERLMERMEKRVTKDAYAEASASLELATGALETGKSAFEENDYAGASFHFDIALKTAIDARELLTNTPRITEKKETPKKEEKRSGRSEKTPSKPPPEETEQHEEEQNKEQDVEPSNETNETEQVSDEKNEETEDEEEPQDRKRSRLFDSLLRFKQ